MSSYEKELIQLRGTNPSRKITFYSNHYLNDFYLTILRLQNEVLHKIYKNI